MSEHDSDPAVRLGAELEALWDKVPAPPVYGVRILIGAQDDDRVAAIYAPQTFTSYYVADQCSKFLSSTTEGEALLQGWVDAEWMTLPDNVTGWIPLGFKVVQFAEIPF